MTIKLPRLAEQYVRQRIKRGDYRTPEELIQTALTMLQSNEAADPKATQMLRRKIHIGLEQLDRGDTVAFGAADIKREGRRLLAARKRART